MQKKKSNKRVSKPTKIIKRAKTPKNKRTSASSKNIKVKSKIPKTISKSHGWEALKPGDLIDVVAPASKCSLEELNKGILTLESWGYNVRVAPDIFGDHLLHAHEDQHRWRHLKNALLAPDSVAIWCARGGYGSMKLLPSLSLLPRPKKQKLFLGLSDITSLNVFFNQKWNWPVLHASILSRVGRGDLPATTQSELQALLGGGVNEVSYELEAFNSAASAVRSMSGEIVGGNWTTLMSSVGTPFALDGQGKFIFLEDIGERGYRLDRYWEQWKQSGFFKNIKGIILGDFTEGNEPNGSNTIWSVLKARASELRKPVFIGIPAGHGDIQRPLPLGTELTITHKGLFFEGKVATGCRR